MAEKIYRCTRNAPYPPGSMGFYNLKERQGYYIPAHSAEEAIAKMQKFFPTDHQGFTAN